MPTSALSQAYLRKINKLVKTPFKDKKKVRSGKFSFDLQICVFCHCAISTYKTSSKTSITVASSKPQIEKHKKNFQQKILSRLYLKLQFIMRRYGSRPL